MKIKVGAVSPSPYGDRFRVMGKYVENNCVDLICFPEEFFGYDFINKKPTFVPKIEVVKKVSKLARENNMLIVTGFLESVKNGFYNKSLLISPTGLLGEYTKINPTKEELKKGHMPGKKIRVFNTKLGKISMLICYEAWFPELARIATYKGAEIICFPTGLDVGGLRDKNWLMLWWARAIENTAYVIGCVNAIGKVSSMICGPEKILALKQKSGVSVAELDLGRLRKIREGKIKANTEMALLKRRTDFLKKLENRMVRQI